MSGSSETSSCMDENWSSWFCSAQGNEFFCEIDRAYIEDSFNLFGLKQHLPVYYGKALDTILDRIAPNEAESEEVSRAAVLLYGLIHARYIITSNGLDAMHRKYQQREFGECPRMLCRGQPVLPMGFTDEPKVGMVKLFCPKCRDVYSCPMAQRHLDGAFYGPTFPNLFFMTYESLVPEPVTEHYIPKVFGFKIHPSSNSIPKQIQGSHQGGPDFHASSGRSVRSIAGSSIGIASSSIRGNGNAHGSGIGSSSSSSSAIQQHQQTQQPQQRQFISNATSMMKRVSDVDSGPNMHSITLGQKRTYSQDINNATSLATQEGENSLNHHNHVGGSTSSIQLQQQQQQQQQHPKLSATITTASSAAAAAERGGGGGSDGKEKRKGKEVGGDTAAATSPTIDQGYAKRTRSSK